MEGEAPKIQTPCIGCAGMWVKVAVEPVWESQRDQRQEADRLEHQGDSKVSVQSRALSAHGKRIIVAGQSVFAAFSWKSLSGERGISVIGTPSASSIAAASTAPTGSYPAAPAPCA